MRFIFAAFVTLFGSLALALAGDHSNVASDALSIIRQVHEAADKKDAERLRTLMVKDFIWSFGGDKDADQAIAEWQKYPEIYVHLSAATSKSCTDIGDGIIECPANAEMGYRAGFKRIAEGWRMIYFVVGD